MVEIAMHSLWKNRLQQNTKSFRNAVKMLERKKLVIITKKKISVVKSGRRKDTKYLRYTLKKTKF